jgi:hypothetical protein
VAGFVHSYNTQWLIGRLGHRTPKLGLQGRHHKSSGIIRQTSKSSNHPGAVQGQRIGAIFAGAVHSHELGMGRTGRFVQYSGEQDGEGQRPHEIRSGVVTTEPRPQ